MNRFRRYRWGTPIAILAMVALLWSQLLFANHAGCTTTQMAGLGGHGNHGAELSPAPAAECHKTPAPQEAPLCASHCSQGDLSKESARAPVLPMLGPVPMIAFASVLAPPAAARPSCPERTRDAWHGPTQHPASILLI